MKEVDGVWKMDTELTWVGGAQPGDSELPPNFMPFIAIATEQLWGRNVKARLDVLKPMRVGATIERFAPGEF